MNLSALPIGCREKQPQRSAPYYNLKLHSKECILIFMSLMFSINIYLAVRPSDCPSIYSANILLCPSLLSDDFIYTNIATSAIKTYKYQWLFCERGKNFLNKDRAVGNMSQRSKHNFHS